MSKERIKELFGEISGEDLDYLFVYGSDNTDFKRIGKSYNIKKNCGLFVIQHIESGEYYGLVEYNLDSWGDGSSTAYEQGYPIHSLTPEEVTVTQYNFEGQPVRLDPENDW